MITELTEDTVKDFIQHGSVVIRGYLENCSFCEKYEPIFASAAALPEFQQVRFGSLLIARSGSEFKRLYMRANIGEKTGAPCTFLFRDGEFVARHHGLISGEQLCQFIREGKVSSEAPTKTIKQLSIIELKAYWLDQILGIERSQAIIQAIQVELNTRSPS